MKYSCEECHQYRDINNNKNNRGRWLFFAKTELGTYYKQSKISTVVHYILYKSLIRTKEDDEVNHFLFDSDLDQLQRKNFVDHQ